MDEEFKTFGIILLGVGAFVTTAVAMVFAICWLCTIMGF